MKNLKKVLALVVALTMVLGTVGFAAYTDVAEDAGEYTAVSTLSSLGILTGYEDGTFKPDGDITRAEFAAVVCRALGAKVSGTAATAFTDVAADHWASGYIAYVAGAGIVNGMGDGTFAPDANVTYEQAVKMLVVALGYEPMATQKGGYPTGYMVVANTYGMTEGISAAQSAAASRGVVAQLTYNALDIPMMVQNGFGTQISYAIADGKGDNPAYQSLLTGLDVAKLEGAVTGTAIIPSTANGNAEVGYVWYEYTEANDDEYFEDELDAGRNEKSFAIADGVNADAYFGYSSIIYVRELSRNKYEIIAVMPGEDSQTMEFGIEDLEAASASNGIEYYTSSSKNDTKTIKLASGFDFYWNYDDSKYDIDDLNAKIGSTADIEITVIENSGDNKYDVVIVKEYAYARVDTVEAARDRFNVTGATVPGVTQFTFDFDDDTIPVSIVDKNGDAIEIADFAEDDVVAFISDNMKGKNYKWVEVVNLGQNVVTGTIDEVNTDTVYIDSTEYGIAVSGVGALGDEGTFYLTRTGKIFASEKSASVSGNYAYILGTSRTTNDWEPAWQVKLLTKENEIVTYTVRDPFEIDGVQYDNDVVVGSAGILDLFDINNASSAGDYLANANNRIVTYKLDSKGYIREINTLTVSSKFTSEEYDADAQVLKADLEDDTVIFNISNPTETGVFATGISALVNENNYSGYYVTNDQDEVDCLVITEGGNEIDFTQDLAVVASVTDITLDEGATDAKKVRYYTSSEDTEREIIVRDDDVSVGKYGTTYNDVVGGTIMMFTDDGNGTAAAYTVIATTSYSDSAAYTLNNTAITKIEADENADVTFVTGYIAKYESSNNGTKITYGSGSDYILVKNTTNAYTIKDTSSSKLRVYSGDWAAVDVDMADTDDKVANYFIAKKNKNTVGDIITFSTVKPY